MPRLGEARHQLKALPPPANGRPPPQCRRRWASSQGSQGSHSGREDDRRWGRRRFCHNDLLCGNIMVNDSTAAITLIDFEYGGTNFRGFDIANHFNEWAGRSLATADTAMTLRQWVSNGNDRRPDG